MVLDRSKTRIVVSNSARGMDVYLCYAFLCRQSHFDGPIPLSIGPTKVSNKDSQFQQLSDLE